MESEKSVSSVSSVSSEECEECMHMAPLQSFASAVTEDLDGVGLSRGPVLEAAVFSPKEDEQEETKRCTPEEGQAGSLQRDFCEVRALAISAILYTSITSAQVYAAQVAHSQALLVDCISSSVDAFTFVGAPLSQRCLENPYIYIYPLGITATE